MIRTSIVLRYIALAALLITGCGEEESDERTPATVEHPTEPNLLEPDHVIRAGGGDESGGRPDIFAWRDRLLDSRPELTIGSMSGDADSVLFGKIEDVAVHSSGYFIVLDSRYSDVKVFAPSGELVQVFGRGGMGPEEFRYPEALAFGSSTLLFVTDRANRIRALEFAGDSLRLRGQTTVDLVPEDMCALDEHLYVRTWSSSDRVVHRYTVDGRLDESLVRPYVDPEVLVRSQMSDGPIACSESGDRFFLAFEHLPYVRAFDTRGEELWITELHDFEPSAITSGIGSRGTMQIAFDLQASHRDVLRRLTAGEGVLIAQVARSDSASLLARRSHAELHTYVLDPDSGEGVFASSDLPEILALRGDHLYAAASDPFPHVLVYRMRGDRR